MRNSSDIKGLKGKAAEEPYPGLFMFAFIQVKSTINKKSRARILTNYVRPNVSWKRQNETKRRLTLIDDNLQKASSVCSFLFAFQVR